MSQALPHTNHPLGQLFWQVPMKGTAWAGQHSSASAGDSWGGEHAQAVGEESSPTCSPAEPPWLSDSIYPADICLLSSSSAGPLRPRAGLLGGSSACCSWDFLHGALLLPRAVCKLSPCPVWGEDKEADPNCDSWNSVLEQKLSASHVLAKQSLTFGA